MNLCSICINHVNTNCIFCDSCKLWVHKHLKSLGAKRVMRQNQKIRFSLVFASNVLALCYVNIFFRKTSYEAV